VSRPLFLVEALPGTDEYTLEGAEGHHAATVQRLGVGEELMLGDGHGSIATAVVTAVGRGRLVVRIRARTYQQQSDPRLVVVQGIAKGDRGELAVQAMTEVGVDAIVPWSAARSIVQWHGERGARARRRWVDTAREAAKQAQRAWLPDVTEPESTDTVTRRVAGATGALVLHKQAAAALSTVELPRTGQIMVVVGPEGGVTPEELATFERAGAIPVRLGAGVLRTSTAGVAALAVLSVRLARW
jgi:16S rRNA (uracil1498-N3)-methyltransferase